MGHDKVIHYLFIISKVQNSEEGRWQRAKEKESKPPAN